MTLFRNNTHRDIWKMRWCDTCYHGKQKDPCPIWTKALKSDRKPPEWDRVNNTDEMERTIRCNEYAKRPPLQRRKGEQRFEDVPLFDVEPAEVKLVPVEGWLDKPRKGKDVDHQ